MIFVQGKGRAMQAPPGDATRIGQRCFIEYR